MSMYSSSTVGKAAATSQYAFDDTEKREPKRKNKPEDWSIPNEPESSQSPQSDNLQSSLDSEEQLTLKLNKTKQHPKLLGASQKDEKISLTARLRKRKDKGKSEYPGTGTPKDEKVPTERKRSTTAAPLPTGGGRNKQGQIDNALSSWLGSGVTAAEVRKMDAQPKEPPKKKKSVKREVKRNRSKLGHSSDGGEVEQKQEKQQDELTLDDSNIGPHYAFLGSSHALQQDHEWREEDEDDIDIDALPNEEKADHFIGSIEDQEESSVFTMSRMWPPFNPVGEYKGDSKDGIPHGTGQLMFLNGKKYLGEWKLGRRDGVGKMYWPCGNVYVGGFQDDKKHGKGEETTRHQGVLVAEWEHGKPHGKGVLKVKGTGTFAVEWDAKGKITDFRETKKT